MAEKIYTRCIRCAGSGIAHLGGVSPDENPCGGCGGTGKMESGTSIDLNPADDGAQTDIAALAIVCNDIMDKCNDIKDKCDEIKEVVDGL
jgi:hypothetical protein